MKQNKYDDPVFFEKYGKMERSQKGLDGAGEWKTLEKMLPDFVGKRVLDLGCGYGWHCRYALEHGAAQVVGVDISQRMLEAAQSKSDGRITYRCLPMEDIAFPGNAFDVVISSLALHYVPSFEAIAGKVYALLSPGGDFVFSVEHPIFTAQGGQEFIRDSEGKPLHFPVDRYFMQGQRDTSFLGEKVIKYHRTLEAYAGGLISCGFAITGLAEPMPPEHLLDTVPGMRDELRRPMMLILSAQKR